MCPPFPSCFPHVCNVIMEASRLFSFRIDKTQEEKTTFFTYDFLFYQEENSVSEFFQSSTPCLQKVIQVLVKRKTIVWGTDTINFYGGRLWEPWKPKTNYFEKLATVCAAIWIPINLRTKIATWPVMLAFSFSWLFFFANW